MKIAIWGLGVSGLSTLKYLSQKTDHELIVINSGPVDSWADEKVLNYISLNHCISQEELNSNLSLDQIVLSPGIDPRQEVFKLFKDIPRICEVELAFREVDKPIIAITGTNGKTTTVTLITEALRATGKKVFLGGNIGTPFCEYFFQDEVDYIVLELSSFQLELMDTFKADFAAILNVTKTHMERYDSFDDYKKAKLNIFQNQDSSGRSLLPKVLMSINCAGEKKEIKPLDGYSFSKAKWVGNHNKENFFIVSEVLNYFQIENTKEVMQNLIDNFKGVKYRLEYLGNIGETLVYNDAKSTNSSSTMSALNSFQDKTVALIAGGKLRDLTQDHESWLNCGSKKLDVFAFGESKDFIQKQISEAVISETLSEAFSKIEIQNYDIILFSPGYPSFDQYQNYVARGEDFERIVKKLF